jgi:hypothetical protein
MRSIESISGSAYPAKVQSHRLLALCTSEVPGVSAHHEAAVDRDRLSGDIAGFRAAQPQHSVRDLFRSARAPHRDERVQHRLQLGSLAPAIIWSAIGVWIIPGQTAFDPNPGLTKSAARESATRSSQCKLDRLAQHRRERSRRPSSVRAHSDHRPTMRVRPSIQIKTKPGTTRMSDGPQFPSADVAMSNAGDSLTLGDGRSFSWRGARIPLVAETAPTDAEDLDLIKLVRRARGTLGVEEVVLAALVHPRGGPRRGPSRRRA